MVRVSLSIVIAAFIVVATVTATLVTFMPVYLAGRDEIRTTIDDLRGNIMAKIVIRTEQFMAVPANAIESLARGIRTGVWDLSTVNASSKVLLTCDIVDSLASVSQASWLEPLAPAGEVYATICDRRHFEGVTKSRILQTNSTFFTSYSRDSVTGLQNYSDPGRTYTFPKFLLSNPNYTAVELAGSHAKAKWRPVQIGFDRPEYTVGFGIPDNFGNWGNFFIINVLSDVFLDFFKQLSLRSNARVLAVDFAKGIVVGNNWGEKDAILFENFANVSLPQEERIRLKTMDDYEDSLLQRTMKHYNGAASFLKNAKFPLSETIGTTEEDRLFIDARFVSDPFGLELVVLVLMPEIDFMKSVYDSRDMTIGIVVACLVVMVAAAILFSVTITRPVSQIAERMILTATLSGDDDAPSSKMKFSILSEVYHMQAAYLAMREELMRVKMFLPQNVLDFGIMNDSSTTDSGHQQHQVGLSNPLSSPGHNNSSGTSRQDHQLSATGPVAMEPLTAKHSVNGSIGSKQHNNQHSSFSRDDDDGASAIVLEDLEEEEHDQGKGDDSKNPVGMAIANNKSSASNNNNKSSASNNNNSGSLLSGSRSPFGSGVFNLTNNATLSAEKVHSKVNNFTPVIGTMMCITLNTTNSATTSAEQQPRYMSIVSATEDAADSSAQRILGGSTSSTGSFRGSLKGARSSSANFHHQNAIEKFNQDCAVFMRASISTILKERGVIEQQRPEQIIAFFSRGVHSERAARCALKINKALAKSCRSATIVLHAGSYLSGACGSADRNAFVVTGEFFRHASKLIELSQQCLRSAVIATDSVIGNLPVNLTAVPVDNVEGLSSLTSMFPHHPNGSPQTQYLVASSHHSSSHHNNALQHFSDVSDGRQPSSLTSPSSSSPSAAQTLLYEVFVTDLVQKDDVRTSKEIFSLLLKGDYANAEQVAQQAVLVSQQHSSSGRGGGGDMQFRHSLAFQLSRFARLTRHLSKTQRGASDVFSSQQRKYCRRVGWSLSAHWMPDALAPTKFDDDRGDGSSVVTTPRSTSVSVDTPVVPFKVGAGQVGDNDPHDTMELRSPHEYVLKAVEKSKGPSVPEFQIPDEDDGDGGGALFSMAIVDDDDDDDIDGNNLGDHENEDSFGSLQNNGGFTASQNKMLQQHQRTALGDSTPLAIVDINDQVWLRAKNVPQLGEGAFSKVFLGMNTQGDIVALKVVDLKAKTDLDTAEFLQTEVAILSEIHHPNLASFISLGIHRSLVILVLEYVAGGTLKTIITSYQSLLPRAAAKRFALNIIHGLIYLHEHEVVHGDIKPENVLIGADSVCKLTDFGSAVERISSHHNKKNRDETTDNDHQNNHHHQPDGLDIRGTAPYMAPEVAAGNLPTAASDIWSFGVLLHELITGKLPWGHAPQAARSQIALMRGLARPLSHPDHLRPKISFACDLEDDGGTTTTSESDEKQLIFSVVNACLQENPEDRPTASALAMRQYFL